MRRPLDVCLLKKVKELSLTCLLKVVWKDLKDLSLIHILFDHVEVLLEEMNFPEELVVNRSVDVLKQEILQHREIRKIGRD